MDTTVNVHSVSSPILLKIFYQENTQVLLKNLQQPTVCVKSLSALKSEIKF